MSTPRAASRRRRLATVLVAAALVAPARPLGAQSCAAVSAAHARTWAAPLDRAVSLRLSRVRLRDALDRVSAAAGVPLAYSPDLVALGRPVCLVADDAPLGEVLDAVLAGSGVGPAVVAGRVVLAPRAAEAPGAQRHGVDVLERVVVSERALAAGRDPLRGAVSVVEGAEMRRQSLTSLADVLDGVGGAWLWGASPASLVAQYGGIRGASSFGASAPKIYLDGVEVADPLLVTQLDPDVIDRVEVIRGPQGSALYGAGAISGVVNVLTRHDGRAAGGSRLVLSSTAGVTAGAFGAGPVATHDQRLALRVGDDRHSAGLAAQYGQSGATFPSAESRQSAVVADARAVGAGAIWSASARLFERRGGGGPNPLLAGFAVVTGTAADSLATPAAAAPQAVRQYTLSASVLAGDARWTHSLVAGIDGYRLATPAARGTSAGALIGMATPLALAGAGERSSLRATSTARRDGAGRIPALRLTLGADESLLRLTQLAAPIAPLGVGDACLLIAGDLRQAVRAGGAFGQAAASWDDAWFVTAGARVEHGDAFTGGERHPVLPTLGVATVQTVGDATLTVRAAYGRAIRDPAAAVRAVAAQGSSLAAVATLDAESQAGTELAAELRLGDVASVQVTRFDQVATGLVQRVGSMQPRLENVGEIGNRGWEVQGSVAGAWLALSGTLTLVDSRVRTVVTGYGGDLRAGDRMLGVPARTASLTASWLRGGWSGALTASRAARWIGYDRLGLARDFGVTGALASDPTGAQLRSYWMAYDGDTHLRVTASRPLREGVDLLLTGENLLGGQLGEPDNATIRAGRTVMAGVRAGF